MDEEIARRIEEFKRRTIYRALDPATLASIPDDKLEQAVMDYVITKLEERGGQEAEVLASLSPGVRALYHTWLVDAEVCNGGFNQYYWNTEGRHADAAVEAFEFFGAIALAELMREANRVRARDQATMEKFRKRGTLEAFSESYEESSLEPETNRYFELNPSLAALRIAKIRAAPELFSGG